MQITLEIQCQSIRLRLTYLQHRIHIFQALLDGFRGYTFPIFTLSICEHPQLFEKLLPFLDMTGEVANKQLSVLMFKISGDPVSRGV